MLCDSEDLSFAARYVDPSIRAGLTATLREANNTFHNFFGGPALGCFPGRGGSPASNSDSGSAWSSNGSTAVGEVLLLSDLDTLAHGGSVPPPATVPAPAPAPAPVLNSVPARLLETCVLAARIMRNTLTDGLDGLDDPRNGLDVLVMYENVRFMGLKAWTGLPYVYVWV